MLKLAINIDLSFKVTEGGRACTENNFQTSVF